MKKNSLFFYVLMILLSLTLLSIGTISFFSSKTLSDSINREVENSLISQGRIISNNLSLSNFNSVNSFQQFTEINARGIDARITLIALDGEVLADSHKDFRTMENHSDRPEVVDSLNGINGSSRRFSSTLSEHFLYITIAPENSKIIIRLALSIDFIGEKVLATYKEIIVFSLIILAVTILISIFTARIFTKTINAIKDISTHYSNGVFSKKLPENGPREVSQLKETINIMGGQLQNIINRVTLQKNELQAMFNSMEESVILLDKDLSVKEMNRAAEKLTDKTFEECKSIKIINVIENETIYRLVEGSLSRAEIFNETIRLDQNLEQYVQVHCSPVFDSQGNSKRILLVLNNITRIKKLENMRQDFVSNVSHELKTPITLINGYVETLLDGAAEDKSKRNHFLSIINRHSNRLNSIIDDLLILSNIEDKGKNMVTENILLYDLLFSAYTSAHDMAREENIKIEIICHDKLQISANAILMEQAVFNLINNAVKYSGSGSKVLVMGKQINPDGEKKIEITVEDNGVGIDEDQIDRIFERFYRINKKKSQNLGGTGLGLSIVRHIALAHNGNISVISNKDRGCKFSIILPCI